MTVVDSSVHPMMGVGDDIREYFSEPLSHRRFPNPDRYFYPAPDDEYLDRSWPANGGAPASDPALVAEHLFGDQRIDSAILLPLTRGVMPDVDVGSAICAATNDWLAARWLGNAHSDRRFFGSIRVNPADPIAAVKEIERWSGDPRMVQVAVPLEAHKPYGQREYFPIWEAAALAGLPVAIHADGGTGVELQPSPVGYFHHYIEYMSFLSCNGLYHLVSFIAEGVFDRLPAFRVLFADGMGDMAVPVLWRMDSIWRAIRDRTPWVTQAPSEYLEKHVRFCAHSMEGPTDPAQLPVWWRVSDMDRLQMYASNYPHWTYFPPDDATAGADEGTVERFLGGNAREWFRLREENANR